jgi:hypothetical protein
MPAQGSMLSSRVSPAASSTWSRRGRSIGSGDRLAALIHEGLIFGWRV